MNANKRKIAELETALNRALDDVREAGQRKPELSSAEMLSLQTAAHAAWRKVEEAKKAGASSTFNQVVTTFKTPGVSQ